MCIRDSIINSVVVESKNNEIENGNVIERVVSESDTLKIDSETVSEREKMISCNEVIISVVELEKEWKERVDECGGQRVNFPLICDEPRCSKVLLLEGKRPLLVIDLSCLFLLNNFVPSAWNERESMIWCYDERALDGELCVCLLYTSYYIYYILRIAININIITSF